MGEKMKAKEDIFLLTVEEVADILRVQPLAVFKRLYGKELRAIKLGCKTVRFRKSEPYRYINWKESQNFYVKGKKFENIGDVNNTVDCLKNATSIYPLNKSAHLELGKIYYKNIKEDQTYYELAKQRFEKGLKIDFEDRDIHLYLGKMGITPQELNSHNSNSIEEELLTIKELSEIFRVQYLKAYEMVINNEIRGIHIGRWKIRRTEIERYLEQQESELVYKWAIEEKELGNIDNAMEYFKETTRIYPFHRDAHLQLAEIYCEKMKSDKIYLLWALKRLEKAFKIDPERLEIQEKIKELEKLKN
ncbi:MAG: excisionase family DNA-binding protein [bacterium]